MKYLTVLLTAAALAGCAATGTQVSQSAATQFKEGVTTESEIVSKLGPPNGVTLISGKKVLIYSGAQVQVKAASFIPVVGMFAGGSDYTVSVASFQLDGRGILEKVTYTTQGSGTRMGTTPAPMNTQEPTAK